MVVKKYLTVLSGKFIPDSAGCLNFNGYRIPVSGSGTSLTLIHLNFNPKIQGAIIEWPLFIVHLNAQRNIGMVSKQFKQKCY
jgi:hypothetical protein